MTPEQIWIFEGLLATRKLQKEKLKKNKNNHSKSNSKVSKIRFFPIIAHQVPSLIDLKRIVPVKQNFQIGRLYGRDPEVY